MWLVVQETVPQPQTLQPHCLDKSLMSNMHLCIFHQNFLDLLTYYLIIITFFVSMTIHVHPKVKLFQEGNFFIDFTYLQ